MLVNGIERRRCRCEGCVDCIDINLSLPDHNETIPGVCMNISEGGFCVFTSMPLAENQAIELKENPALSPKKKVVKWSHLYFKQYYKYGMMLAA